MVDEARALVARGEIGVGSADAHGYAWIDVPPVKHFEIIVLTAATKVDS